MRSSQRQKKRQSETEALLDVLETPVGRIYIVFRPGGVLINIRFSPEDLDEVFGDRLLRRTPLPVSIREQFERYFEGCLRRFNIRYDLKGSAFDVSVLQALNDIPYGETRSYQWVAERIGKPGAVRAVGQALKRNPLPILLPCHRVVNANGTLGGYSSGVEIKRRLLALEYYNK